MSPTRTGRALRAARPAYILLVIALTAAVAAPMRSWEAIRFAIRGLIDVGPIVLPGIALAAWIMASNAGDRVAVAFHGRAAPTILAASAVGAFLPVCGITVLPLMAGLLAAGVPLAPVMAFWLASPVTDPPMLAATVATLGWPFAVGKTAAAFGIGIAGGVATLLFGRCAWVRDPLRRNRFVDGIRAASPCGTGPFNAAIWREPARRAHFARQFRSITRLILVVLIPAFVAEFLLNAWLEPDTVARYIGPGNDWAIPLAVVVGGPAYVDGYAALPLTRALLKNGMSAGAAMAFLVSGGVVSIWGAMAIFPVLRLKPFLLYLAVAVAGSLAAGWIFGAIA